jgi:2-polyprenyl-3-methyl-5-hydroxy-6-metoxy-1,4-benzoquinol methylase
VSLDVETGRDRYFEAREHELEQLLDPATGRVSAELVQEVSCPVCGSGAHAPLFEKQGFTFVRCGDCSLVFVNPQLKESVLLDEYRSARTNDLWFEVLTSERQQGLDREKFTNVLDSLEPYRTHGRVVDVGCSLGLFLDLARARGWDGIGLELAPRALAHARDSYGLEVLDKPLADAAFEAESFDVVTLLSVLEHASRPLDLLLECARVLRPGGALYVIVPNVESLACRVLHARARTFDGRNHLVYFSPTTLGDALARAGLDVVSTTTRISSLEPVLAYLAYGEPYVDVAAPDPLRRLADERRPELERLIEHFGLGYKLHCLATKQR